MLGWLHFDAIGSANENSGIENEFVDFENEATDNVAKDEASLYFALIRKCILDLDYCQSLEKRGVEPSLSFGNFNLKVNSKSKRKARALLGGGRLPTVGTHCHHLQVQRPSSTVAGCKGRKSWLGCPRLRP